jgi:hypothetical protein
VRLEGKQELSSNPIEALKELVHDIRTPLGVAMVIAKDAQRGLELSSSDYDDCVIALEKINRLVTQFNSCLSDLGNK